MTDCCRRSNTRQLASLDQRRKQAASDRATAQKALRDIAAGFAKHYPAIGGKPGAGQIFEDIARADRLTEWNIAVQRLVCWALSRAVQPEQRTEPWFLFLNGRLGFTLAQGFHPHASRPPDTLNTEHDALILLASGAKLADDEDPADGPVPDMTMGEAKRILAKWDRASLLPGQSLVEHKTEAGRDEALRKRVTRAAKKRGLRIMPGKPFGRT